MGSWLNGVQMAAINIQKQDRYWVINRQMFLNTPYRLKPVWMRNKDLLEKTDIPGLRALSIVIASATVQIDLNTHKGVSSVGGN